MEKFFKRFFAVPIVFLFVCILSIAVPAVGQAGDLQEIKQRGVLKHLGVTYANFVKPTPSGFVGLDVDLMKLFAKHVGVEYQFVSTDWGALFSDLTGYQLNPLTHELLPKVAERKGDIIANGLTILPWRQKIVSYSEPTFPTGVWLLTRAQSPLLPIIPSGNEADDIDKVKELLFDHSVLTMDNTCLDAKIYNFDESKVIIRKFTDEKVIDRIVPAMLEGQADATLLDIPDALIALEEYQGEIKIIGPVAKAQDMGIAVPKSSPELLREFNIFFAEIWKDGTYRTLVTKYYPSIFLYANNFFDK